MDTVLVGETVRVNLRSMFVEFVVAQSMSVVCMLGGWGSMWVWY